jgi:hypothetical protein
MKISEALTLLKSKNFELMKYVIIPEYCWRKMEDQNSASMIFNNFYSDAQESVFWTASCNCLILPLKKSYYWHNDEKVRYKGDVTGVIHTLFLFF